ncbi:hypothetical protein ASE14_06465 [Agromyces sp. Root81]|nr:hypothetical protein ASE14_06465 [Agromyces sp. Root81]
MEDAAARTSEATTIGSGGIRVKDGGSIVVEAPGTIDLQGGAFSANSLAAATTVTAGGDIQGGGLVSTGTATIAGTLYAGAVSAGGEVSGNHATFPGGIKSTDVHSRSVTYGGAYSATWTHVDGTMGTAPSSERFKQDIVPVKLDVSALERAEVVTFRYRDAVANVGDDAEVRLGGIAEQFVDAGLGFAVTYGEDGLPFSIEDRPLVYALLAGYQALARRVTELEA